MSKSQQQLTVTLAISKGEDINIVLAAIRAMPGVTSAESDTPLEGASVGQIIDRVNNLNRNDRDQVSGALCATALRTERIANMTRLSNQRSEGSNPLTEEPGRVGKGDPPLRRKRATKLDIDSVASANGRSRAQWVKDARDQLDLLKASIKDRSLVGKKVVIDPEDPRLTWDESENLKRVLAHISSALDAPKEVQREWTQGQSYADKAAQPPGVKPPAVAKTTRKRPPFKPGGPLRPPTRTKGTGG